ncbi:DUF4386 domain-containing protein [Arthrobacter sp. CAN_C5]|uniref:DUF4386 domain-containing protein n=1 Tax=Arthrobacter sp. CAN_C5 TaxID=2760706 RepID=UPI001AEAAC37|nr:DUF4386 domain-containing protein [Arthrobacter sp. CAN_C5]MBP2215096.1 hypothetical protein [Arthrobacter sp. CAN_C5]
MEPQKGLARTAGALYLAVAILAGFAIGFVRNSIYVSGDPGATLENIAANEGLFRLGILADLTQSTLMLLVAMALYMLLRHVNKHVAGAMVLILSISVAIQTLNLAPSLAALKVATNPDYAASLGSGGAGSLVMVMLDLQRDGFLIAQVFFGLWLLPLGYLVLKSAMFPRGLGVLLMIACFSYLAHLPFAFLWPEVGSFLTPFVAVPATVAELWMVLYLLIKGVRKQNPAKSPSVAV